jgi:hypothetical protein
MDPFSSVLDVDLLQIREGAELMNKPIRTITESGNAYIDGTYRLWMDPKGAIRIKFDKSEEIFYISKKTDLYDELSEKMFKEEER